MAATAARRVFSIYRQPINWMMYGQGETPPGTHTMQQTQLPAGQNGSKEWHIARGMLVGITRGDGPSRQPHMQGRKRCQGVTPNPGKRTINAQHLDTCWPKNGTKRLESGKF